MSSQARRSLMQRLGKYTLVAASHRIGHRQRCSRAVEVIEHRHRNRFLAA